MNFFKSLVTAVAASLMLVMPAMAAPVLNYTISGTGSGTLAGNVFNDAEFTITMIGDAATFDGMDINPLLSSSVTIVGFGTTDILIPTRLGINGNIIFYSRSSGSDLFDFRLPGGALDLTQPFGPVAGIDVFALHQFVDISSSLGSLTFRTSSDVLFQAVDNQVVPEPPTGALAALALLCLTVARRVSGVRHYRAPRARVRPFAAT